MKTTEITLVLEDSPTNEQRTILQSSDTKVHDELFPMLIVSKDQEDGGSDSWNIIENYDVVEETETLVPFQTTENLFQEHF